MRKRLTAISILTSVLVCGLVIAAPNSRARRAGQGDPASLIATLKAAKKPAVGEPLVIDGTNVCGPKGKTTDKKMQALNNNKNRTDEPATDDYIPVEWETLENLPANAVQDIQGAPVTVVGYLSHKVNVENKSPGESTNCNLLGLDEVDWHMYLTEEPDQSIAEAIIVETTPRVRPQHTWTTQMLGTYVNTDKQVRISGWLMYDFQHLDVVGSERVTVWEVHPITRIEVQNDQGNWVNIEQ